MPLYMKDPNSGEDVPPSPDSNYLCFFSSSTGVLFTIYANGLNTTFQSDDEQHIFLNLEIDNPAYYLNLEKITYRQVTLLTFALNYQMIKSSYK